MATVQHLMFRLDTRETQLVRILPAEYPDVVEVCNLDLGDFNVVVKDTGQIVVIVERKSIQDFAQSIKDHRYHEQKARMMAYREANPITKLVYVIEGNFSFEPTFMCQSIPGKTFTSCILGSMMRDNIHCLFTKNILDTFELFSSMIDRLSKEQSKYFPQLQSTYSFNPTLTPDNYHSLIKTKKKDNIDCNTCLIMQLCSIPGISSKKAQAIVDFYEASTMTKLLKNIADKGGTQSMKSIHGFGKANIENIEKFLM
jgi:ERCC4-type nuclease